MVASPKVLLADLTHKDMSFKMCRSVPDSRPIGSIILNLPEKERIVLKTLKSDDIKNDILALMPRYGYHWFDVKRWYYPSKDQIWNELKEKFIKWLEKKIK